MKLSGREMTVFIALIAPLLFLIAALLVPVNIWVIMLAILWLGTGLTILYLPSAEE
ncbi:MAG TPA: hypothetical protein PKO24_04645 [Methanomassiliicoccales archaeon]|nr:hypothetical protein [Euryarchaeota archaeon]HOE52902.1 hypothetical protein [Methanomassiliicoccales archaeon]HOO04642.1 hypothetical protein [Methanomassiliicoccales archaeon]